MSKDYKAEIDIFIKTLEESVNIFNIIRESNNSEEDQIKYLICVTEEMKKFCNQIIPSLKSLS